MWRIIVLACVAVALGASGCTTLGLTTSPTQTTVQSQIFAFDDANAQRTRDIMDQVVKHWKMNSAAVKQVVGKKIGDTEFAALNSAVSGLDDIASRAGALTDEDYGRGIILFGQFLDAGGRAIAANVIPQAIALYQRIQGL